MIFGWQTKLIILALGAALAFGGGWKTRDAFCDAAAAKKQVEELSRQIRARDAAAVGDQQRAAADAAVKEQLEGAIRALEGKIAEGECFSADDVSRIRGLWLRSK